MATSVRRTNVKFCTEDGFCVDAVQCLAYLPPEHCVCFKFCNQTVMHIRILTVIVPSLGTYEPYRSLIRFE